MRSRFYGFFRPGRLRRVYFLLPSLKKGTASQTTGAKLKEIFGNWESETAF